MMKLVTSPWRATLEGLVGAAEESLLLASPFIKTAEAQRLSDAVLSRGRPRQVSLTVLTDFRPDSILNESLDVGALKLLATRFERCTVISVPRLHAKVYVADRSQAVITSANLTTAGLDQNMEYGVEIRAPEIVEQVVEDLSRYGKLGSPVPLPVLEQLTTTGQELASDYRHLLRSVKADMRRQFNAKYAEARRDFVATQVGNRSANAVFSEAILYTLSERPLSTAELHPRLQGLLPDLCDDDVELIINGEHFGKKWKHQVRNAQQFLKRAGLLRFDGKRWSRSGAGSAAR